MMVLLYLKRPSKGIPVAFFSGDDPNLPDKFRKIFGPEPIDQQIRQVIQLCWMMLPEEKRSVDEVDRQIRRIVDRALHDLREDFDSFGLGES
jgi:hypothetical protein